MVNDICTFRLQLDEGRTRRYECRDTEKVKTDVGSADKSCSLVKLSRGILADLSSLGTWDHPRYIWKPNQTNCYNDREADLILFSLLELQEGKDL
jgi:hypothetical protein